MTMESGSDGDSLSSNGLHLQTAAAAWLCTVGILDPVLQCCSAAVCWPDWVAALYLQCPVSWEHYLGHQDTLHCSSIVQRMNKAMENLSFINFLFLCAIIFYFMKIYYSHHVAIPLLLHLSPLAPSSVISAIGTVCGTDSPNSWKRICEWWSSLTFSFSFLTSFSSSLYKLYYEII